MGLSRHIMQGVKREVSFVGTFHIADTVPGGIESERGGAAQAARLAPVAAQHRTGLRLTGEAGTGEGE